TALETRHLGRDLTPAGVDAERQAVRLLAAEAVRRGHEPARVAVAGAYLMPRAESYHVASYGGGLVLMMAAGALALRAARRNAASSSVWHWTLGGLGFALWLFAAVQA